MLLKLKQFLFKHKNIKLITTTIDNNNIPKGIYFLYRNNKVIYIGKSTTMSNRLKDHLSNKRLGHGNRKSMYDYAIVYQFDNISDINVIKPYLISKYSTKYNKEFNTNKKCSFTIN